ncbi:MAG: alpha/beta hydrolase-fold protein [Gemmatimonadota bacterium]|nr:alpha/beta hydrolase-fold protein [Gemmatimonadota bacterium]
MDRQYHRWHSGALGRDMELLAFGHAGARVIVFPTSMGRFWEWEDFGMIRNLVDHLDQGWLQLYCVDSVDGESWYNTHVHAIVRAARHAQYDRYLADELLPFTAWRNPNPFVIATGASFGAYHALAFALRHPERVGRVLGMSGLYDIRRFADGAMSDDLYYANPFDFVANEQDPERIAAMQRLDIIFAVGRDDPAYQNNVDMSARLWQRGIGNALRVWDGWAHDWPYWKGMVRHYIGGHD